MLLCVSTLMLPGRLIQLKHNGNLKVHLISRVLSYYYKPNMCYEAVLVPSVGRRNCWVILCLCVIICHRAKLCISILTFYEVWLWNMVPFLYYVNDVTLLHNLEPFFKSVAVESVCRQIYRRKDKLSRDIPTVTAREQKGVFISQMCGSMYSQWHKDGTCYGSSHPATNRVIDLSNMNWVEAKMANQSPLESVIVPVR